MTLQNVQASVVSFLLLTFEIFYEMKILFCLGKSWKSVLFWSNAYGTTIISAAIFPLLPPLRPRISISNRLSPWLQDTVAVKSGGINLRMR